jgi:hypothetical protein
MKAPILYFFILFFFFNSCKKEKQVPFDTPVLIKTDLSIPTSGNVVDFDFIDNQILCAVNENYQLKIFYSNNSGSSWEIINTTSFPGVENKDIANILIFNDSCFAIVCGGYLYRTFNKGANWSRFSEFGLPTPISFATKTSLNRLYFFQNGPSIISSRNIYSADYFSTEFYVASNFTNLYSDFIKVESNQDVVTFSDINNVILIYNILNDEWITIETGLSQYEHINSIIKYNSQSNAFIGATENGKVFSIFSQNGDFEYNFHQQNYFCVREIGSYIVSVGDKTISTNKSGEWKEVISTSLTKWDRVFYNLEKKNNDLFYLSGDNGLFYEAKISLNEYD